MGLKCSVLGHTYGETTVERDREEQGSEVVITIQETETCTRCGHTRVVSENKEVTAIETPSDIAGDVVDEEAESNAAEQGSQDESVAETTDADPVSPAPPGEDDAEIMESSDGVESGDAELDEPATTTEVPDAEGGEPTPDPDPEEDDAVILDDSDGDDAGRAPGEWPEDAESDEEQAGEDEQSEWEPVSSEETDDGPDVEPLGGSAVTVPEGQFRCPECGFTTDVEASSLRAGDFCPECQKGALVTEHTD